MTEVGRAGAPSSSGVRGRDAELDAILRAMGDRGAEVVWVTGHPGTGRSAILRRAASGAQSLSVRCAQAEKDTPFAAATLIVSTPSPGSASLQEHLAENDVSVLLVDDARWCDEESWHLFRSWASATSNTVVAAVPPLFARIEEGDVVVDLPPLPTEVAEIVLSEIAPEASDVAVSQLIEAAEGNPLALVELAGPGGDSVTGRTTPLLEAAYHADVEQLSPASREAIELLAVADWRGAGTPFVVWEALIAAPSRSELAHSGLVLTEGELVRFAHSAVRREVLAHVVASRRREAARRLAPLADGIDALWLRAAATSHEDPGLASELEEAAHQLVASDPATAARLWERAATVAPSVAGRRWILAAEAHLDAQDGSDVPRLLRQARLGELDLESGARALLVEGFREVELGNPAVARQHLLAALRILPRHHLKRSRAISIVSEISLWYDRPDWAADLIAAIDEDEAGASVALRVDAYLRGVKNVPARLPRGDSGDQLISAGISSVLEMDDHSTAQVTDALSVSIPRALTTRVLQSLATWHGGMGPASVTTGGTPWELSLVLAARAHHAADEGDVDACRAAATESIRLALLAEFPFAAASAQWALGRVLLQGGEPAAVVMLLDAVLRAGDAHHRVVAALAAPDLIEALTQCGDSRRVLELRTQLSDDFTDGSWAALAYGRAYALSSPDSVALLAEGAATARATGRVLEEARSRLLLGETLRRARRRIDARTELRSAHAAFAAVGASGWAARAVRELDATNEIVRRSGTAAALTSRQFQIAELVAEGASNQEIAARLGMSRKTVEHHLHNAYASLGVRSRRQLVDALIQAEPDNSV